MEKSGEIKKTILMEGVGVGYNVHVSNEQCGKVR